MEDVNEMFSPFQKELKPKQRLVPHLFKMTKYNAHYRMLQLAVKHGFVIDQIHSIVVCDKACWLKDYIELNNKLRTIADTNGEKFKVNLNKNMNNFLFGKMIEDVRKRVKMYIKKDDDEARKIISKPNFKRSVNLNDDMILLETTIASLTLDRPIYVGAAILELAKLKMFEFHYDVMKNFYRDNERCTLLYTDTDSTIYEIRTEDVYKDMSSEGMINHFDFSQYSNNSIQFAHINDFESLRKKNKKVLGKMKDELGDMIMDEFIGHKSKAYSYTIQVPVSAKPLQGTIFSRNIFNPKTGITCRVFEKVVEKGIKENIKKANFRFKHYKRLLDHMKKGKVLKISVRQVQFKSKKHQIHTESVRKVALSATDTKRYLVDHINTLPFGHFETLPKP